MKLKKSSKKVNATNVTKIEPLFFKSFKLAKSSPNKVGLMVLFDLMFLVSIFALYRLSNYFAQSIFVPTSFASFMVFFILSLIYYLIVLFVYSFFKYSILDFIKSMFDKTTFSFKRLGQFYSLNIVIAGIFFAIILVANFLLASVQPQYRPFVFLILAIPFVLFLYVIINASHSLFYEGASMKDSIKKSFKITFTKIKIYRETILIMILFALLLWLLFLGSGFLIRFIASKNYNFYLSTYIYFKQASVVIFDLVFYFIIVINRISFYALVRENK